MKIRTSLTVDVPASEAWSLIAEGFGDVGDWTTAVDSSRLVGDRVDVGAERHVTVSGFGAGDGLVVERITAFDGDRMRFTYQVVSGMPAIVKEASTTWKVTPLDDRRS